MTETEILNRGMAAEISKMGHTDEMMIVDAGLAIPNTIKVMARVGIVKNMFPTIPQNVDTFYEYLPLQNW